MKKDSDAAKAATHEEDAEKRQRQQAGFPLKKEVDQPVNDSVHTERANLDFSFNAALNVFLFNHNRKAKPQEWQKACQEYFTHRKQEGKPLSSAEEQALLLEADRKLKSLGIKTNYAVRMFNKDQINEMTTVYRKKAARKDHVEVIETSKFNVSVTFNKANMTPAAWKLFDFFTVKLTENKNAAVVRSSLEEIAAVQGYAFKDKNDVDNFRRKYLENIDALESIGARFSHGKTHVKFPSIITKESHRNGFVEVVFNKELLDFLAKYNLLTTYPMNLQRVEEKNRAAYVIGRKLSVHFNSKQNLDRNTHNIISVFSLFEECKHVLPGEEELKAGNRHIEERILKPFFDAFRYLYECSVLERWRFITADGKDYDDEESSCKNDRERLELLKSCRLEFSMFNVELEKASDVLLALKAEIKKNEDKAD